MQDNQETRRTACCVSDLSPEEARSALGLSALGYTAEQAQQLKDALLKKGNYLILNCPAGSGKSTTLATTLAQIKRKAS